MRILVACEFSGRVRDAFRERGHEAYSADLRAGVGPYHLREDVVDLLLDPWDLVVAHPPCTYLARAGQWAMEQRRNKERYNRMLEAVIFFRKCLGANSPRICVENPMQHPYARKLLPPPTQVIQPWQFGHGEVKTTWLWLKGLPELVPTEIVEGREPRVLALRAKNQAEIRSLTYPGIAKAMAEQWG